MTRNFNKTMVRKENLNKITGRRPNPKTVMGRKGYSHGVSYRVSKPFPKPIPKTVRFVSFSGKRSPHTARKPLSVIHSTERQHWNTFYSNGRAVKGKRNRIFHKSCTLLCEVTFGNSKMPYSFWRKSFGLVKEPHAEIKALAEIENIENTPVAVRKVDMLLSYSPCANCARRIIEFVRERRPLITVLLAFSALYHHEEERNRRGLKRLNTEPGITLRVFNENDWQKLAIKTDVHYHRNANRKTQDAYWHRMLQEILKEDVVIDMTDNSSSAPVPGYTSGSSRRLECCMGIILLLVLTFVIIAIITQLVK